MKIAYQKTNFRKEALATIQQANEIIAEYQAQGFDLTLRQLYYQFVSRSIIANNEREYKKLGDVVANGRLAGLIDWDAIADRTRYLRKLPTWNNPQSILSACADQFRLDKWSSQDAYIEVFIEKDALIGVIQGVCEELEVPYLACRGYASASEVWNAGHNRFLKKLRNGKECFVLYLGDHDPSGLDMTRDIQDRLDMFCADPDFDEFTKVKVVRLALNMEQVREHQPPPNPTKLTDTRAGAYLRDYGEECWELDALEPALIASLIRDAVNDRLDKKQWGRDLSRENLSKKQIGGVAENWDSVVRWLK